MDILSLRKAIAALFEPKALDSKLSQGNAAFFWKAHAATPERKAKRALNRTIGHRQAKRLLMTHLREARTV
jgi:hypothetical protein